MLDLKYFRYSEFDQPGLPGSGENMDIDFLRSLIALREFLGFPFVISSGWRSPEYNAKISKSGLNGPHTTGKAADILVYGEKVNLILKHCGDFGFTGIGIKQHGPHARRFIHLDTLGGENFPRPFVWSYP